MPTNAVQVGREMTLALGKLLPEQMVKAQKKLTLDFLGGAVLLAAVDTGRMRGNIQAFAGSPVFTDDDPVGGAAKGAAATGGEMQRAIVALADLKPFDTSGVSCGVEYASYVEDGTDRMPAQPFFSPNVERIRRQVVR